MTHPLPEDSARAALAELLAAVDEVEALCLRHPSATFSGTLESIEAQMAERDARTAEIKRRFYASISAARTVLTKPTAPSPPAPQGEVPQSDPLDQMLRIGAQMATVCFNWSQEGNYRGATLDGNERNMLGNLRKEWDAARAALASAQPSAPVVFSGYARVIDGPQPEKLQWDDATPSEPPRPQPVHAQAATTLCAGLALSTRLQQVAQSPKMT